MSLKVSMIVLRRCRCYSRRCRCEGPIPGADAGCAACCAHLWCVVRMSVKRLCEYFSGCEVNTTVVSYLYGYGTVTVYSNTSLLCRPHLRPLR